MRRMDLPVNAGTQLRTCEALEYLDYCAVE